jgi:hypothetical protein
MSVGVLVASGVAEPHVVPLTRQIRADRLQPRRVHEAIGRVKQPMLQENHFPLFLSKEFLYLCPNRGLGQAHPENL